MCNGFVYNGRGNQHVNDNLTIFIENDRCTVLLSNRQQNEQRCVFVVDSTTFFCFWCRFDTKKRVDIVLLSNRQQKVESNLICRPFTANFMANRLPHIIKISLKLFLSLPFYRQNHHTPPTITTRMLPRDCGHPDTPPRSGHSDNRANQQVRNPGWLALWTIDLEENEIVSARTKV